MTKGVWQKEKLHVLCNFFFCHYVFKKTSAAEASESVYMRERVKVSTGRTGTRYFIFVLLQIEKPLKNRNFNVR